MAVSASSPHLPEPDLEKITPVMKAITISISLPQASAVDEQSARDLLVLALVESGRLSQSQGAQTLGISRYDFIELMGHYGIPVVRLSPEEQEQELVELDRLQAMRAQTSRAGPQGAPYP